MQIIFPDEHRMPSRACQGVIKEDWECQSTGMSTTQWDVYVLGTHPSFRLGPSVGWVHRIWHSVNQFLVFIFAVWDGTFVLEET